MEGVGSIPAFRVGGGCAGSPPPVLRPPHRGCPVPLRPPRSPLPRTESCPPPPPPPPPSGMPCPGAAVPPAPGPPRFPLPLTEPCPVPRPPPASPSGPLPARPRLPAPAAPNTNSRQTRGNLSTIRNHSGNYIPGIRSDRCKDRELPPLSAWNNRSCSQPPIPLSSPS